MAEARRESVCDMCPDMGACCKGFPLSIPQAHQVTELQAIAYMAKHHADLNEPMAFVLAPDGRVSSGAIKFRCIIGPNSMGRCPEYGNRPRTCRMYQPAVDSLCVLHPRHGEFLAVGWQG